MRLLVDEDLASDELMARLRRAGHHVETPEKGVLDPFVWRHAQEAGLAVVTGNPDDFLALATRTPRHHGVLLVYGERDPVTQMRAAEISGAIDLVRETLGDDLTGEHVVLNEWRRSGRR